MRKRNQSELPPRGVIVVSETIDDFPSSVWAILKKRLPDSLSDDAEKLLRKKLSACCRWLMYARLAAKNDSSMEDTLRRPGKGQRVPFERLAYHLREAAKAWEIVRPFEAPGERFMARLVNGKVVNTPAPHPYDDLKRLADYAGRRFEELYDLKENYSSLAPWANFARRVAKSLREVGLKPGATGRVYSEGEPTWFQSFMFDLNSGLDPTLAEPVHSRSAFYAAIAKVMRSKNEPRACSPGYWMQGKTQQ